MRVHGPRADVSPSSGEEHELPAADRMAATARTFTLLGALTLVELDAYGRGVTDTVTDIASVVLAIYVASTGMGHCFHADMRRALVPVAAVDVLLISLIVYWTGGVSSMYYPLYFLPIMQAAVRLRLRDALATSLLAGVCYAASLYLGVAHPRGEVSDVAKIATFGCVAVFMAFFCGILMRETRAHRQEAQRTLELYGVATALQNIRMLPDSLQQVVRCIARAMPASRVEIWEAPKQGGPRLLASFPEAPEPDERAPEVVRGVIETGEGVMSRGHDRRARRARPPIGMSDPEPSFACVPAELAGGVLGAIRVVGIPEARPLNDGDLTTLGVVAAQVAVALDAARLNEELAEQAKTDALTGLLNRGEFWRRLEQAFQRPDNFPLCVAMLDVDRLKEVNDTRGHLAGDGVLLAVASLLRTRLCRSALAARYGGDEFVVLLLQTTAKGGQSSIYDLVKAVKSESGGRPEPTFSFSAGIACADAPDRGAEALVAAADVALYQAKRRGGGRVVTAPPNPGQRPEASDADHESDAADAYPRDRRPGEDGGLEPIPAPGPSCA